MKQLEATFSWTTSDGLTIFAKDWSVAEPKAVIALVHGLGEHCVRYDHMAAYYNRKGFAMLGYDRRGHGQSGGKRGHTTSYSAFLEEVDQLFEAIATRYPNVPVILYGHSMGGNIALKYALERKPKVKAVVTTGAWIVLAQEPPSILIAFGRLMGKIYPAFSQPNGLNVDHISRLREEVKKYSNDPLVHDKVTVATGLGMLEAAKSLVDFTGEFPYPLLLQHGGDDQIIAPRGTEQFGKQAKGDITTKIWEGLYHEIHNENIQEQVFDYTIQWISEKM